jgi:hypothetical protein
LSDPFDYLGSRDDADSLIEDFGAVASLRRVVASGTPFDPVLTPTDYATLAVRVEFTWKQLQSDSVLVTDQRWLVAAGPLDALGVSSMLPTDLLVVGSSTFTVVKADTLNPAGTIVLFDCQVRV